MGEKLLIGRYIPYDSFVHDLDARSKLQPKKWNEPIYSARFAFLFYWKKL